MGPVALLPTAAASMATGAGTSGRDGGPNLQTAVGSLLPTPATTNGKSGRAMTASTDNGRRSGGGQSLPLGLEETASLLAGDMPDHLPVGNLPPASQAVVDALLPTPKASDGPNGGPGMRNGRGEADALPGVVSLLPTPRAAQGESRNHTIYVRDAPQQNLENALAFTLDQHDHQSALDDCGCMAWGPYAPALHRWEQVQGRPAPAPTELSATGRRVLSPLAVEFMMGLPLGHVTDPAIGLSRAQQLKALGNGVVPQQAALALRLLLGLDGAVVANDGTLLPTPNPFHAGNEEDPDEWRKRRADVFKRTGTRHGPALGVVAKSLLPGETPLTPDTYMPEDDD